MMRQKKSKFKKQEHRIFIDWFIAVPAEIASSGHQIELRMYEHHFYKAVREELDQLIEATLDQKGEKYENQQGSVWERCVHIAQLSDRSGCTVYMGKEKQ